VKYTFVHNGQSWWLLLKTQDEVEDYFSVEWSRNFQVASRDYERHEDLKIEGHWTSSLAEIAYSQMLIALSFGECATFYSVLAELGDRKKDLMRRALEANKDIFVNQVGGVNFGIASVTSEVRNVLEFPCYKLEDVRVKKWPGGTHYYAYVGNLEVFDGAGNNKVVKWNTIEEALAIATRFLNIKKIA